MEIENLYLNNWQDQGGLCVAGSGDSVTFFKFAGLCPTTPFWLLVIISVTSDNFAIDVFSWGVVPIDSLSGWSDVELISLKRNYFSRQF